tara:strand:- start:80 stop:673 length:594 start_codon:yes stop_codon:yes gene_type:complete
VNWFLVNTNVKTKYRQSILQKRNSLGPSEVSNLSNTILKNADLELSLSAIKTLGSYFSSNNEVDLEALTEMRLKRNLLTTFPRVEPNHSMSLIAPKDFQKLNKNKFEIFEPSDGDEINSIDHEIIIIPTVGVDQNGYRLGYGGGYYDRFLESVTQKNKRPLLVGLIYDFQFIDDSINELHDIKLDIVFSEHQRKNFS